MKSHNDNNHKVLHLRQTRIWFGRNSLFLGNYSTSVFRHNDDNDRKSQILQIFENITIIVARSKTLKSLNYTSDFLNFVTCLIPAFTNVLTINSLVLPRVFSGLIYTKQPASVFITLIARIIDCCTVNQFLTLILAFF